MSADTHLVTYGTLSPGKPNHHQLSGLHGRWLRGTVRGNYVNEGWGAQQGFPAIVLDSEGALLKIDVFESDDLPLHWARLDAFEGGDYSRVSVRVETATGGLDASIYTAFRVATSASD